MLNRLKGITNKGNMMLGYVDSPSFYDIKLSDYDYVDVTYNSKEISKIRACIYDENPEYKTFYQYNPFEKALIIRSVEIDCEYKEPEILFERQDEKSKEEEKKQFVSILREAFFKAENFTVKSLLSKQIEEINSSKIEVYYGGDLN